MKLLGLLLALGLLTGCGDSSNAQWDAAVGSGLETIENGALPDRFANAIASCKILVLGEEHYVQEHQEFVAASLPALHKLGYRTLLIEECQAYDPIIDAYTTGKTGEIPWRLKAMNGYLLDKAREFNATIPDNQKIRVAAIDINHGGFSESIAWVKNQIDKTDLIHVYTGPDEAQYVNSLTALMGRLDSDRKKLEPIWSPEWYARVHEMVEIEILSLPIRKWKNGEKDSEAREKIMIDLIDRRVAESSAKIVLNCGQTHAQKLGYSDWSNYNFKRLGEYIHHKYNSYHIAFYGVKGFKRDTWYKPDGHTVDRLAQCSNDDIVRIMAGRSGEKTAVLTLQPDLFKEPAEVAGMRTCPNKQFDAYVVYPRMTVLKSLEEAAPLLKQKSKPAKNAISMGRKYITVSNRLYWFGGKQASLG